MRKIVIQPTERWLIHWFCSIPYKTKLQLWKLLQNDD